MIGRIAAALVVTALAVLALLVAVPAGPSATGPDERLREVAATLRCPECIGESIADSASPVSEAMRETVAAQLAEGRTPAEIRAWFAARYGDEVLLDPPPRGAGLVLWAIATVLVGVVLILLARGRGRPLRVALLVGGAGSLAVAVLWLAPSAHPAGSSSGEASASASHDAGLAMLHAEVARRPGDVALRGALAARLDEIGEHAAAAEHYAAATRLDPRDPETAYRHALALLRSGDPTAAAAALDTVLVLDPGHDTGRLLRVALAWLLDEPGADELVRDLERDGLAGRDIEADLAQLLDTIRERAR